MIPTRPGARAATLRGINADLSAVGDRLRAFAESLSRARPNAPPALARASIECVLHDRIVPGVRDIEAAADELERKHRP